MTERNESCFTSAVKFLMSNLEVCKHARDGVTARRLTLAQLQSLLPLYNVSTGCLQHGRVTSAGCRPVFALQS